MADTFRGEPVARNEFCAETFADEALGFEITGATIRITFATRRPIDPSPPSANHWTPVHRLVLPIDGALNLGDGLVQFLGQFGIKAPPIESEADSG